MVINYEESRSSYKLTGQQKLGVLFLSRFRSGSLGAKVSAPHISRWRITIPFVARSALCCTKRKR